MDILKKSAEGITFIEKHPNSDIYPSDVAKVIGDDISKAVIMAYYAGVAVGVEYGKYE